jgi:hypothetical protein
VAIDRLDRLRHADHGGRRRSRGVILFRFNLDRDRRDGQFGVRLSRRLLVKLRPDSSRDRPLRLCRLPGRPLGSGWNEESSSQEIGVATVAPGRARVEYDAMALAPCSFLK